MNPVALELGPLQVRWYAVFILTGIGLAIMLGLILAKKYKINRDDFLDGITYGIPIGIIGARLYYVIFEWDRYKSNPIDAFKIWEGGGAIHGAIIAALVFAIWFSKRKKLPVLRVADTVSVGFLIAQIMGRWGNFVNQEAHGPQTTLEFLKGLHLPDFIVEGMNINGTYYHPTFLYESMWNVIGLVLVLVFIYKFSAKPGSPTLFYLIWYSTGRFMIEALRTDSLMIGSIKTAQLISIILISGSLIAWYLKNRYLLKDEPLKE